MIKALKPSGVPSFLKFVENQMSLQKFKEADWVELLTHFHNSLVEMKPKVVSAAALGSDDDNMELDVSAPSSPRFVNFVIID